MQCLLNGLELRSLRKVNLVFGAPVIIPASSFVGAMTSSFVKFVIDLKSQRNCGNEITN